MVDGVHVWMSLSVITGLWTLLCINGFWYLTPVVSHRKMTVVYLRYIDVGQYSSCFLVAGSSRLISVFGVAGWVEKLTFISFSFFLGRSTLQKHQWLCTGVQSKDTATTDKHEWEIEGRLVEIFVISNLKITRSLITIKGTRKKKDSKEKLQEENEGCFKKKGYYLWCVLCGFFAFVRANDMLLVVTFCIRRLK